MPVKLNFKDTRVIVVAVVVAGVSLAIGVKYFSHAFPEASIHFRVNRNESARIAAQFLRARGFHLAGYRHAAVFNYDDEAKLYLERTQGLKRMDRLTSGPVHLWRWSHRWFRPLHKEEFSVDVTPAGQVVGFDHEIRENAPGASLPQDQARSLAESFLTSVMKENLGDLAFVEARSQKRPARTDYTFTWKRKSVHLGAGSLRVAVRVDGNQVAGYQEYVKIPEDWLRGYQKLRSKNNSAQLVDQVFWVLLSIGLLAVLIERIRDRDAPLKLAAAFGAVAALLACLSQLNAFPLAEFSYQTTDTFSSFVSSYLFQAVMGGVGLGVLIFLVVAGSEPVYRESFPQFVSFRRYFTWKGLRSRSFFMANVVGISITFFFFAYQTVFYLAANHLGAWAPSDIPFSNDLNTHIPWVAVLFGGFFPAVSEELQFRAFAIPFLKKLTRSWPLAIILAAFNWGFLHSAYPNEPFFIRGVEVGVAGIIVGIIMLRFGILATLMWHYSVDALYSAFLLLRSPNHYLMFSGGLSAGVMLIPLVVSLVAYLRTGTFSDEAPLTNTAQGVARAPRAEVEAATPAPYAGLSRRTGLLALAVVVVFGAIAFLKVYRLGEGIKIRTDRVQAVSAAERYLAGRGVNTGPYLHAAWLRGNVDPLVVRYFLQRFPVRKTDSILRRASKPELWEVRFFRPLQPEEYRVYLDPQTGRVFDSRHVLDETAPGASLTPEQAVALAKKSLAEHGDNAANFALQGSFAEKRPAREDYTLVWQAKPGDPRNAGGAFYRLVVQLAGSEVVGFSHTYKLPEEWVRRESSSSLINSALLGIEILLGSGLVAGAIVLFVRQVRRGRIPWAASLKVAVAVALLLAISDLNQLPLIERAYPTSVPLSSFELQVAVSLIVTIILGGALLWLLVGLTTSLYPEAWRLLETRQRRVWRRDAGIALVAGLAVSAGMEKFLALFADRAHAYGLVGFPSPPQALDAYLPAFDVLGHGLIYGVAGAAALGALVYGVMEGWRRKAWWLWAGGAVLLVAIGPPGAHSFAEWAAGWSMRFIPLVAAVALLALFFRNNPLAYCAGAFCSACAPPLIVLLSQPAHFFRWNGVAAAILVAGVLIWLFAPGSASGKSLDSGV